MRFLILILAGALTLPAQGSDLPVNYAGHYELADNHSGRNFVLDLSQKGTRVHVHFSATDSGDLAGEPTGKGSGRINDDGILEFTFKDNFDDQGTATFAPASGGYRIELRITNFVDPSALHFYGAYNLKKMSDSSQKVVSSN